MNKELFVTSTPTKRRWGWSRTSQLAEIYLEREGEYTLAGSIYKGRVTRVLPGMQSAFVDIGLERDAFLYVSDFLELEDAGDGDEESIPARPMPADGEVGEEPGEIFVAEGGSGEARPQRNGSGDSSRRDAVTAAEALAWPATRRAQGFRVALERRRVDSDGAERYRTQYSRSATRRVRGRSRLFRRHEDD